MLSNVEIYGIKRELGISVAPSEPELHPACGVYRLFPPPARQAGCPPVAATSDVLVTWKAWKLRGIELVVREPTLTSRGVRRPSEPSGEKDRRRWKHRATYLARAPHGRRTGRVIYEKANRCVRTMESDARTYFGMV